MALSEHSVSTAYTEDKENRNPGNGNHGGGHPNGAEVLTPKQDTTESAVSLPQPIAQSEVAAGEISMMSRPGASKSARSHAHKRKPKPKSGNKGKHKAQAPATAPSKATTAALKQQQLEAKGKSSKATDSAAGSPAPGEDRHADASLPKTPVSQRSAAYPDSGNDAVVLAGSPDEGGAPVQLLGAPHSGDKNQQLERAHQADPSDDTDGEAPVSLPQTPAKDNTPLSAPNSGDETVALVASPSADEGDEPVGLLATPRAMTSPKTPNTGSAPVHLTDFPESGERSVQLVNSAPTNGSLASGDRAVRLNSTPREPRLPLEIGSGDEPVQLIDSDTKSSRKPVRLVSSDRNHRRSRSADARAQPQRTPDSSDRPVHLVDSPAPAFDGSPQQPYLPQPLAFSPMPALRQSAARRTAGRTPTTPGFGSPGAVDAYEKGPTPLETFAAALEHAHTTLKQKEEDIQRFQTELSKLRDAANEAEGLRHQLNKEVQEKQALAQSLHEREAALSVLAESTPRSEVAEAEERYNQAQEGLRQELELQFATAVEAAGTQLRKTLQAEKSSELAALQERLEQQRTTELQAAEERHSQAQDTLRQQLSQQRASELEAASQEHKKAQAELRAQLATAEQEKAALTEQVAQIEREHSLVLDKKDQEISCQQQRHESEIASLRQNLTAEKNSELDTLRRELELKQTTEAAAAEAKYTQAEAQLRQSLGDERTSELAALRQQLEQQRTSELESARTQHASELEIEHNAKAGLQQQLATARDEKAKQDDALQQNERQLTELRGRTDREAKEAEQRHKEALNSVTAQKEEQAKRASDLESELNTLRETTSREAAAAEQRHSAAVAHLQAEKTSELAALQKRLDQQRTRELESARTQHASELEIERNANAELQQQLATARDEKARQDDALQQNERQLTELRGRTDREAKEAEQRHKEALNSVTAQKEEQARRAGHLESELSTLRETTSREASAAEAKHSQAQAHLQAEKTSELTALQERLEQQRISDLQAAEQRHTEATAQLRQTLTVEKEGALAAVTKENQSQAETIRKQETELTELRQRVAQAPDSKSVQQDKRAAAAVPQPIEAKAVATSIDLTKLDLGYATDLKNAHEELATAKTLLKGMLKDNESGAINGDCRELLGAVEGFAVQFHDKINYINYYTQLLLAIAIKIKHPDSEANDQMLVLLYQGHWYKQKNVQPGEHDEIIPAHDTPTGNNIPRLIAGIVFTISIIALAAVAFKLYGAYKIAGALAALWATPGTHPLVYGGGAAVAAAVASVASCFCLFPAPTLQEARPEQSKLNSVRDYKLGRA